MSRHDRLDIDVFDVRRVRQGIKLLYRPQSTAYSPSDVESRSSRVGYDDIADLTHLVGEQRLTVHSDTGRRMAISVGQLSIQGCVHPSSTQ